MITASDIISSLSQFADPVQRENLMRFFRTGNGDYGEGDIFLGLKVPQTRSVVREARGQIAMDEIGKLLESPFHEARLAGLLLLVEEMRRAVPARNDHNPDIKAGRREEIADFFLTYATRVNNWDLVDLSCQYILGPYLLFPAQGSDDCPDRSILDRLAESTNLWKQRISVVTTLAFIRTGQYDDSLRICSLLLGHPHDLIHKAVGWILREVGKRDKDMLLDFLEANYRNMARTTLRYSIEKFPEPERLYWLRRC